VCFGAGTLLPGVIYNASGTVQPNMALLGANFAGLGNTTRLLGPNFFSDTLNVSFSSTNAVGFDVFPGPTAGNVNVTVYDAMDGQLGTFIVAAPIAGAFFGVISDAGPIGRINISSQTATPGELIDNMSFDVAIPEPASILLTAVALALFATRRSRA